MVRRFDSRRSFVESLEDRRLLAGDCFHVGCIDAVEVEVRDSFLPDVPFLVTVKLRDDDGAINRNVWDADAIIEITSPINSASTPNKIEIYNGVGSGLVQVDTETDTLTFMIAVGSHQIETTIQNQMAIEPTAVSGEIATDTTWSGIVEVASDVTVLSGVTLTIAPGTLVLVEGVETTVEQSIGTHLIVDGTLSSNGTAEQPVTFTAADHTRPWGGINVSGGSVDLKHTNITFAGNSRRGGHTMTGPAIRLTNDGSFSLTDGAISDIYGKTMQANTGQVNIERSLLTRSVMGPETQRTGVSITDTWIVDMDGRFRYDEIVDDNDGIYLHAAQLPIELRRSVVANVRDDGIDTAGATALFEDMIVRNIVDKGFSVSGGQVGIEHSLIADVGIGVETKVNTTASPQTTINRTTIANAQFGVRAEGNSSEVQNLVTNSIIDVIPDGDAISVEGDEDRTIIRYSLANEDWEYGGHNQIDSAGFVNASQNDFRLRRDSSAVDAGDPELPIDQDGSPMDLGFYSSSQAALNTNDIDAVCEAIRSETDDSRSDFNSDSLVDIKDHDYLITEMMGITYGDANADGVFDSKDLVQIFQAGEYEDDIVGNSTWAEGDWNCDGEFNTSDLVAAFRAGRYVRE